MTIETMTVDEVLAKVQLEIEDAIFSLHHSIDPSREQQCLYTMAFGHVKGLRTLLKKAESMGQ